MGRRSIRDPRLFVIALLVVTLVSSPVLAQEKGLYEPVPLRDKREPKLLETVSQYEDLFIRRGLRYRSPELEALVESIGRQFAPEPTDEYISYRFGIFRDPFPNAFALPDGQIYVTTGMLSILENEAQLAVLLGHEIAHTQGHHGILSYRNVRKKTITSMVLGPLTFGLSDYFLATSIYGYSRDLEHEADERGLQAAIEHDWDPRAMVRLWELLDRDIEGEDPEIKHKWRTHPEMQERMDRTSGQIVALGLELEAMNTNAEGFLERTRPMALETVQALIKSDYPRHAVDLAQTLVQRGGEQDAEAYYALGDAHRALRGRTEMAGELSKKEKRKNQKQRSKFTRDEREAIRLATEEGLAALVRSLDAARQAYERALQLDETCAEAHRGMAYVLELLGNDREAGKSFVSYLNVRPEATDRPVILNRLKEITKRLKEEDSDAKE